MITKLYKSNEIEGIITNLKEGKVVGFPTDTVYGLAIIYDNINSFNQLASVKKRKIDKPISMMVNNIKQIYKVAFVDERAKKIIETFMPGAITIILKAKHNLPHHVTLNQNTVGIRIPTNKTALSILEKIDKPLLVTSANIASFPPLIKVKDVLETFDGQISSLVDEDATGTLASTVVDLSQNEIKILREGPISLKQIQKALGE